VAYQPQTGRQLEESSRNLAALAEKALQIFREESPEAHKELVQTFEGKGADVALFGHGRFHVAVQKGEVSIEPNVVRGGASTGRGAIAPETLLSIVEGRLTPLEAFFNGDLIARAGSADLHLVYENFVKFSEAALRSKRLQELLGDFRELVKL
jgi:hypothetical protein